MRRRKGRRRPAPGGGAPWRRERPRDISQPYSAMVESSLLGMVGRNSADAGELQQPCRGGRRGTAGRSPFSISRSSLSLPARATNTGGGHATRWAAVADRANEGCSAPEDRRVRGG